MDKAHYQGDWRKFVPNRLVGPDVWGAWYLPISAHYFDGTTTIFYKPVPPDQLPQHCLAMSKQVVAQQQQGKEMTTWLRLSVGPRSQPSLLPSPTSPPSGGRPRKAGPGATKLTKSQRELLRRFRKQTSNAASKLD